MGQDSASPEIDACEQAARRREQALTGRAHERARIHQSQRDAARDRDALAERRATGVEKPLGATIGDLNRQRDLLARSAGDLGRDLHIPEALTTAEPDAAEERIERLASLTGELVQAAAELGALAAATADSAAATLNETAHALEMPDEGPVAVVERAHAAAESARFAVRTARDECASFAAKADYVEALRELLGEVQNRERALADLAAALKEGAFLKWLTLRRSRNLLVHASRTLEQISNGRFAFVEPNWKKVVRTP